jgi:hypothetical protein
MKTETRCKYRVEIVPTEQFHVLRPCKKEACFCNAPDIRDKYNQPLRVSVMDCRPMLCPLFEPKEDN